MFKFTFYPISKSGYRMHNAQQIIKIKDLRLKQKLKKIV